MVGSGFINIYPRERLTESIPGKNERDETENNFPMLVRGDASAFARLIFLE